MEKVTRGIDEAGNRHSLTGEEGREGIDTPCCNVLSGLKICSLITNNVLCFECS